MDSFDHNFCFVKYFMCDLLVQKEKNTFYSEIVYSASEPGQSHESEIECGSTMDEWHWFNYLSPTI